MASVVSDGLMSRHLRAQGEHVAPGDMIIALDGKSVVSNCFVCTCKSAPCLQEVEDVLRERERGAGGGGIAEG